MKTPMDNLPEPHFPASSLKPGVSGESVNAPYGPKAVDECGIMDGKAEGDRFEKNHPLHGGFAVGGVDDDLAQSGMGGLHEEFSDSSVKP